MVSSNYAFKDMSFNISSIIGTNFANSILNCYLFGESVNSTISKRLAAFTDFTDFYTSFLFNMLSVSL